MLKITDIKKFTIGSQKLIRLAIILQQAQDTNLGQEFGSLNLMNFRTGYYQDVLCGFMEFQGPERQYYVQQLSKPGAIWHSGRNGTTKIKIDAIDRFPRL